MENEFDVVIMGGGLAGLTLGRQLLMQRPQTRLAVVEKRQFPVCEAAHKVGESTVEIGAHYFSEVLQLRKHLTEQQLPKFGLRFFFKDAFQNLAEGTEVGGSEFFAAPSYQVDRGRLENHLAESLVEMGGTLIDAARVRQVELTSNHGGANQPPHILQLDQKPAGSSVRSERTLQARWLVDASGRASVIKRMLQLEEDLQHDINAAWFRIDAQIQVDQWCEDPSWRSLTGKVPRRWLSTNHLMGPGYWVWLIPLASGTTSIGIVADPRVHPLNTFNSLEKAWDWLAAHEPECFEHLSAHRDRVQDFLAIRNMSRGSRQVYSADRWALVGEAAAFLDPFYSPGSDFIAIGNTMVTRLVLDDLAGNSITQLAPTLQSVFLTLFQNNLLTYRDQYPLFGNPRIMALKFVWDYAVYWGFPALLYFNDKLTDVSFIHSLAKGIEEIRDMNVKVQQFFRDWHEDDPQVNASSAFVDQSQIELMTRMNAELKDRLDDGELRSRFETNVNTLRDLMYEIASRVRRARPLIPTEIPDREPGRVQLEQVFHTLNI